MNESTGRAGIEIVAADELEAASDAIGALLAEANDTPYLLETVMSEKCYGAGAWGAPKRLAATVEGNLAGLAVISGSYVRLLAVRRNSRGRGVGSLLLSEAERLIRKESTRVVIGGEPGNYFVPGVIESDENALRFFERRGYLRGGIAQNLEADLRDEESGATKASPVRIERAAVSSREEVLGYIAGEFGRLWAFEVSPAFEEEQPPLFVARENEDIVGFSAHDVNNRGLGFYGPAGVSRNWRGGGIGALLLKASLRDLSRRGYARVIIPWVSSIEFYRKIAHAEPTHRFVEMKKEF